jgi:hypothetical protein
MTRPVAGLLAALAVLAVAVVVTLSRSDYRVLGSNRVTADTFVTDIGPGERACQVGEILPAGTGNLRITIGDRHRPTPPVRFAFEDPDGTVLARGGLRPGWTEGRILAPFDRPVRATSSGVRWCVRNRGDVSIQLAGQPGEGAAFNASIGDRVQAGRMRLEYLTARPKSWWSSISIVTHAFGFGKARHFSGTAPLWVAGLLVLCAFGLAAVAVLRAPAERAP